MVSMESQLGLSVGFGLFVTGSYVLGTSWTAVDYFGIFAGSVGVGLGLVIMWNHSHFLTNYK